jgi:hypothetical protein
MKETHWDNRQNFCPYTILAPCILQCTDCSIRIPVHWEALPPPLVTIDNSWPGSHPRRTAHVRSNCLCRHVFQLPSQKVTRPDVIAAIPPLPSVATPHARSSPGVFLDARVRNSFSNGQLTSLTLSKPLLLHSVMQVAFVMLQYPCVFRMKPRAFACLGDFPPVGAVRIQFSSCLARFVWCTYTTGTLGRKIRRKGPRTIWDSEPTSSQSLPAVLPAALGSCPGRSFFSNIG